MCVCVCVCVSRVVDPNKWVIITVNIESALMCSRSLQKAIGLDILSASDHTGSARCLRRRQICESYTILRSRDEMRSCNVTCLRSVTF